MIKYSKNLEDNPDNIYLKCGECDSGVLPLYPREDEVNQCNNCNAKGNIVDVCAFCYKNVDRRATVCPNCNATREIYGDEKFENIIPPHKWLKGIFIFIFLFFTSYIIALIFDNQWIGHIGSFLSVIISLNSSHGKKNAFDIHVVPHRSDWYR